LVNPDKTLSDFLSLFSISPLVSSTPLSVIWKKRHESICPSGRPLYWHAPSCWSLIPGYVILFTFGIWPSK
jgi:hypothetical protein